MPKIIIFVLQANGGLLFDGGSSGNNGSMIIPMDAVTTAYSSKSAPGYYVSGRIDTMIKKSTDGKSLSWYNSQSAWNQFNDTLQKVYFLAIA